MKWSEGAIARYLALYTFNRRCVVLVDRCGWTGHECDVLGVSTCLRVIDVEIKISRSDLRADAKKQKWWHRIFTGYGEEVVTKAENGRPIRWNRPPIYNSTPLDWPRMVWKHYYCMPRDIWDDSLFACLPSKASGVLLIDGNGLRESMRIECVRRAKPNRDAARLELGDVMNIARLANLRMWDAYQRAGFYEVTA